MIEFVWSTLLLNTCNFTQPTDKLLRFLRQLARVLEGLEGEESELLFKYERLHQPHLDEESGGVEGEKLRAAEVLLDARHVFTKTPLAEKVLLQAFFGRSDVHLWFKKVLKWYCIPKQFFCILSNKVSYNTFWTFYKS